MNLNNIFENDVFSYVSKIVNSIELEEDHSPANPRINHLLSELVHFTTLAHDPEATSVAIKRFKEIGRLSDIQALCQRAESLMEKHYCALICETRN